MIGDGSAALPDPAWARALGDPTRHRIFRHVAEAGRPVTVAELTGRAGLHHNAVRQHLAKLRAAGLVVEEREARDRPGRPRLLYRIAPGALDALGGAYERLALLLVEVLRSGRGAREVGREAGRKEAAARAAAAAGVPVADPVALLEAEAARQGFSPRREPSPAGEDLVLDRCPFGAVAAADPATVCDLHLGLAEGFLDELGRAEVDGLLARDPQRAGCRLHLHPAAPAAGEAAVDPG